MITIKNTPNLTGVTITGDVYDLRAMVDAFYAVSIDEYDTQDTEYVAMSIRILGLCYDIRHASMGDREIVLLDNEVSKESMQFNGIITPNKNVYFQCNYLYPEMLFVMSALNELIKVYMRRVSKKRYDFEARENPSVLWNKNIAHIRMMQSAFAECCEATFAATSYKRWMKMANNPYHSLSNMTFQYIDVLNIRWIQMDKEKRLKNWFNTVRRILEPDSFAEYRDIREDVNDAARQYVCPPSDIDISGTDYPEDIEW